MWSGEEDHQERKHSQLCKVLLEQSQNGEEEPERWKTEEGGQREGHRKVKFSWTCRERIARHSTFWVHFEGVMANWKHWHVLKMRTTRIPSSTLKNTCRSLGLWSI